MKILIAILMLVGSALVAEDLTPTAQAAPTPAPLAAPWDHVTLKDGQQADGKIRGYDAFFLEFQLKNATQAHLPWMEIAELKPAEFSGDAAFMKQYIKADSVEVQSRIEAKSAPHARMQALYPGFFIHGYGFKDAGNQDMFLSLAGAELFGLLVGGFGGARAADPTLSRGERDTANSMLYGGAGIFALTWLIDIVGSGFSADNFNAEHKLSLSLLPQGAAMTASVRF